MALSPQAFRMLSLSAALQRSPAAVLKSNTPNILHHFLSRPSVPFSILIPAISLNIPGIISDIWEGILKAVPKKKTSHMKKRHRQLAGKALKDVNSINLCSACGRPKKAHVLCPFCVSDIKQEWAEATKKASAEAKATT